MEKLIKIKARFSNGSIRKFRTTNFTVKPFRDAENPANVGKPSGLYIKLDDGYTFACKSIEIEQKEIQPAFS